jgi:hypothetical protein
MARRLLSARFTGAAGTLISVDDAWCPEIRWRRRTARTTGKIVALVYEIQTILKPAGSRTLLRLALE